MRSTPRSAKVVALLAGTALIAAACGSSKGSSSDTTGAAASTEAPTTEAGASTSAGETGSSTAPAAGGMTLTIKLNPDAVWDDGTPITSADLECTWKATLNTPGSITTAGYDKITNDRRQRPADRRRHVLTSRTRPTRTCSPARPAASSRRTRSPTATTSPATSRTASRSRAVRGSRSRGARTRRSSSPTTSTGSRTTSPRPRKVVMVPKADSDTEINSLKSGEVDMIFPQAFAGITDALNDPNIKYTPGLRHELRGPVLPAAQRPLQGSDLPPGLLDVGRPRPDPEDHLRARSSPAPSCCSAACGSRRSASGATTPSSRTATTRPGPRSSSPTTAGRRAPTASGPTRAATCRRSAGWSTPATSAVRTPRP